MLHEKETQNTLTTTICNNNYKVVFFVSVSFFSILFCYQLLSKQFTDHKTSVGLGEAE